MNCVVLSAGASTRMGTQKALLPLPSGVPLVRAWVDRLREVGPVTVVTGACHAAIVAALDGRARVVRNTRWSETGALESLLLALQAPWTTCLVTPVDAVVPDTVALRRLCEAPAPAALGHDGVQGHPVVVDAATLQRLRGLQAFHGGLRAHLPSCSIVEAGPNSLANLNTPAAWAAVYGWTS